MARLSLRRYDHQALASLWVSIVSLLAICGLMFLILRNLSMEELIIYYGPQYRMAFLAGTAITILLSSLALGLGFNSVGQRRNDKQKFSWLGFFIGGGVLSLTIVLFLFFWMRGESVIR